MGFAIIKANAIASGGAEDLATVLEMMIIYNYSKYLSSNLYYGHAFGKDVIKNIYAGDKNGDYFFAEFKLKF